MAKTNGLFKVKLYICVSGVMWCYDKATIVFLLYSVYFTW